MIEQEKTAIGVFVLMDGTQLVAEYRVVTVDGMMYELKKALRQMMIPIPIPDGRGAIRVQIAEQLVPAFTFFGATIRIQMSKFLTEPQAAPAMLEKAYLEMTSGIQIAKPGQMSSIIDTKL